MPRTVDESVDQCRKLIGIHAASGWELAARLATVVQPNAGTGIHRKARNTASLVSAAEYASYGIRGLKSVNTILYYVNTWLESYERPKPGETFELPNIPWPPQARNQGSRTPADPAKAVQQAVDKVGADAFAKAVAANPVASTVVQRTAEAKPDVAVRAVQSVANASLAKGRKPQPTRQSALEDLMVVTADLDTALTHWTEAIAAVPNPPKAFRELVDLTAAELEKAADIGRVLVTGQPLSDQAEAWLAGKEA
jgi:hypothetical protein